MNVSSDHDALLPTGPIREFRRWLLLVGWLTAICALCPPTFADRDQAPVVGIDPDRPLSSLQLTRWTTDDGLPANSLVKVEQSADGHLWISSLSGLARFDGISFKTYDRTNVPGLTTDAFGALERDRFDRLWIGTRGTGLWLYEHGALKPFGPTLDWPAAVYAVLVDDQEQLWIGLDDIGAFRLENDRWVALEHESLQRTNVNSIVQDAEGAIWFATFGKGLVRLHEGTVTVFDKSRGMPTNEISVVRTSHDGSLWVGTSQGLVHMVDDRIEVLPELRGQSIGVLTEDRQHSLWIGTLKGFWRRSYPSGRMDSLLEFHDNALLGISGATEDREGNIWFATFDRGLFQLRDSKFRNLSRRDGLATDLVESISQVGREYWLGTNIGVINILSGTRIDTLKLEALPPTSRVRDIFEDRDGVVWISSDVGLLRLDQGEESLLTTEHGLPEAHMRQIYQDSAGRLWVGTSAGLALRIGDDAFRLVDLGAAPGSSSFILSLGEDLEGNLLVATRRSLIIVKPNGERELFTSTEGLPGTVLFSTVTDSDGGIWLATNAGLGRLHNGEIRSIDRRKGLPVDSIYDLKIDERDSVWMSSAIGVVRVPRQQLIDTLEGRRDAVEAELFDNRDGMSSRECIGARKIFKDTEGALWFPTLGGVSILDPTHSPINSIPPSVSIARFEVDGEILEPSTHFVIEPGHRLFVIEFSVPSFVAPTKMKVRYRLDGFDEQWTEAGLQRRVRYTNLPHGQFTFRVEAANADGVWSEDDARIQLTVRPFFYETLGFYLGLGLLSVLAIFALVRWRTQTARRRNMVLRKSIVEQRRSRAQLKRLVRELEAKNKELEQLSYSFSHDLKTPLVTIEGFLGYMEEDSKQGRLDRVLDDAARIRPAVARMNRLINGLRELLTVSRQEEPRQRTAFHELAEQAVARARLKPDAVIEIQPDMPTVSVHHELMLRMLTHLIENTDRFRRQDRPPRARVGAFERGGETVFFVQDEGIGIDPEHQTKIFGLFDRLNPKRGGIGIGLVVAERVIQRHGGRIWVESEGKNRGATFCFTLGSPAEKQVQGADIGVQE